MALQLRRGTNAQRLAVTPVEGELVFVTDWQSAGVSPLWLGNGTTQGGIVAYSGIELDDLEDVVIVSPLDNQILQFDSATNKWGNVSNPVLTGLTAGNITVGLTNDNTITTTTGDLTINAAGGIVTIDDIVSVTGSITNNGILNTNAGTASVYNSSALALSIGGAATTVNLGATTGTTTVRNNLAVTGTSTLTGNLTVDSGVLRVDTATNRVGINNATPNFPLDVVGDSYLGGNTTITADLAVNGGDITSTSIQGNLFNVGVVDINIGNGATTAVRLGAPGAGTTQIKSALLQVDGEAIISGNLTVNGTTTSIDTVNLVIEDNIITLNKNQTSEPASSLRSGIEVERGTLPNVSWQWNENNNWWEPQGNTIDDRNIFASNSIVAGQVLATNGNNIYFNNEDGSISDSDNANIVVKRGVGPDVVFRWNESVDRWQSTIDGSNYINLPNHNLDTSSNPTFAGVTGGNISVGVGSDNAIDTTSGNLTIRSEGGTVIVDDNLTVNSNLVIFGTTTLGDSLDDTVNINSGTVNIGTTAINTAITLGNASTDTVTVNATTNFNNNLTIGSSAADALTVLSQVAGNVEFTNNATTTPRGISGVVSTSDHWFVGGGSTDIDSGFTVIASGDNGQEPIYARQYNGNPTNSGSTIARTLTLLDNNGDTRLPGNLTVGGNGYIYSATGLALALAGNDVSVQGDLTVYGNEIKSGTGLTVLSFNDVNARVAGELTITGNKIRSSGGSAFPLGSTVLEFSGANTTTSGNLTVTGNLTVNGTTTTINSTTLDVDDINITVAKGALNSSDANGAGITVDGANATLVYQATSDCWVMNKFLDVPRMLIDNIDIDGNTISSTDINGNIVLDPNGTGVVDVVGGLTANTISSNAQFLEDLNGDEIVATIARTVELAPASTGIITSTNRKAMKVMVVAVNGSDTHVMEALVMRDPGEASGAQVTFYAELKTGAALATFIADYDSGTGLIRLIAETPAGSANTTFKVVRTALF